MTAPLERVAKAASTTAFGLSAAAVAFFLFAAAIVVGFLFWQTNNLLTDQVLGALNAEARILASELKVGGSTKLTETVTALSRPGGTGLYYLADRNGTKIAGNLNRIPPELESDPRGGVFSYQPPKADNGNTRLAVAIPVDLGADVRLIIGRDIEDQRLFAELGPAGVSVGIWRAFADRPARRPRRQPPHSQSHRSHYRHQPIDHGRRPVAAHSRRAEAAANSMRWPEISTRCSTASKA